MKWNICYRATEEDILKMIKLDSNNYIGNDVGDFNVCLSWLKKCPELYTILKGDNEIIGYINFMPVTREFYEAFKRGEKKDCDISPDNVLTFVRGDNYCIFVSIVIDDYYRDSLALAYLISGFKKKLGSLKNKGILLKNVLADCVSDSGEQLAINANGKYICDSYNGSKVYELDFDNLSIS